MQFQPHTDEPSGGQLEASSSGWPPGRVSPLQDKERGWALCCMEVPHTLPHSTHWFHEENKGLLPTAVVPPQLASGGSHD